MGELIDFAERQKSRRKKKASSIPPIFRKFRVHAIRLLASIIKSGSYSVAYIVKKITGKLIKFYTILTIFIFVVEYIAGDIGYKSIYNAALLLILLTFINILASVYLNKLLRTKMKKLLIPLIAAGSLLYLPASHAEDPCKVIMCMAGKLTGDSGGSECNSAEAAFFNIVKKNKHGFLPNHTKDARKAFLNECPDNGEGGSNQSMISQIISKYGKVRL